MATAHDILPVTVFYPDAVVEGAAPVDEVEATKALRERADAAIREYFGPRKVEVVDDFEVLPNFTDLEGEVLQWYAHTEVKGRRPATQPDNVVAYQIGKIE